ncbi:GON-4-like protein isoform X2 [Diachasma alloeum]|nr:GON-4-like protein isoform X2 [Diachasma alloeum]
MCAPGYALNASHVCVPIPMCPHLESAQQQSSPDAPSGESSRVDREPVRVDLLQGIESASDAGGQQSPSEGEKSKNHNEESEDHTKKLAGKHNSVMRQQSPSDGGRQQSVENRLQSLDDSTTKSPGKAQQQNQKSQQTREPQSHNDKSEDFTKKSVKKKNLHVQGTPAAAALIPALDTEELKNDRPLRAVAHTPVGHREENDNMGDYYGPDDSDEDDHPEGGLHAFDEITPEEAVLLEKEYRLYHQNQQYPVDIPKDVNDESQRLKTSDSKILPNDPTPAGVHSADAPILSSTAVLDKMAAEEAERLCVLKFPNGCLCGLNCKQLSRLMGWDDLKELERRCEYVASAEAI